jgi:hypothetical protein
MPCLEVLEDRLAPATVTRVADDNNAGSLRWAIGQVNQGLTNLIDFNIGNIGTPQTIALGLGPLPAITAPVLIDGFSQGGGLMGPWVAINGQGAAGAGLTINSGGVTIRGLAIDNFNGDGIQLNNPLGSAGDTVLGVSIGAGLDGKTANIGNIGNGITITGSNNTVGDVNGSILTVVSGNAGNGVAIVGNGSVASTNNSIAFSDIGVDATGLAALANGQAGVLLQNNATRNNIGVGGAGNVISGNSSTGVSLSSASTNYIIDNWIGLGRDGLTAVGNGSDGVTLASGSSNNQISGDNVISSNQGSGIRISGNNLSGNQIQGNLIGTTGAGDAARGNGKYGVFIDTASSNSVGTAGAGNVISGNTLDGVYITGNTNQVVANYIGTDRFGSGKIQNGKNGVNISGSSNTVGGAAFNAGNVISGNALDGVYITGNTNRVAGNYIGTDVTGMQTTGLGNGSRGVEIDASTSQAGSNNFIGLAVAGGGNVISGNGSDGVSIRGNGIGNQGATLNTVQNNYIGVGSDGKKKLSNVGNGVYIWGGASQTTVGGTAGAATRNVISGNSGDGVSVVGAGTGNIIEGDYIGLGSDGTTAVGNTGDGVFIGTTTGAIVGGAAQGATNVISANGGFGVNLGVNSKSTDVEGNTIGLDQPQQKKLPNTSGWQNDQGTGNTWVNNTHN